MGFAPNGGAVLAQYLLHQLDGHFLNGVNAFDAEVAEGLVGARADLGNFADGEGREEGAFGAVIDLERARGFGLAGGDLAHRFAGAHAKRNGQTGFLDNAVAQFAGELPAAEEPIHAAEVGVKLIDGGFLTDGHSFLDDFSYRLRVLHVIHGVAADDEGFGTHEPRLPHGHAGMHAERPSFVTAGGHHSAVTRPADEDGLAHEPAVHEPFNRDKKSIEVEVQNGTGRRWRGRVHFGLLK